MTFTIKQNNTSPSLEATLSDATGTAINLVGATVKLRMKPLGSTTATELTMTIVNGLTGQIRYDWLAADTDTVGTYQAEFEVTYSDSSIETFPNDEYLTILITPEL